MFLPNSQPVALLLCATLGAHHWFSSTASNGHAPADFAMRCGKGFLNDAISNSLRKRALSDCALYIGTPDDQQQPRHIALVKAEVQVCVEEAQSSAFTCAGGWSDSSSSSDDSGSDLDASQHGGSVMSVMPSPGLQSYQVLLAATKFVRDGKERLAAVIRDRFSSY